MTNYTLSDAMKMMAAAGIDFSRELSNVAASYADITDEIEAAGGEADFTTDEYKQALSDAAAGKF